VESDRSPHGIDIGLADAMTFQEVAGCVRAINLKTLASTAVLMGQPHVVKHATAIEQFGIELETTLLSGQRAPVPVRFSRDFRIVLRTSGLRSIWGTQIFQ
jgi:hypothetical protein